MPRKGDAQYVCGGAWYTWDGTNWCRPIDNEKWTHKEMLNMLDENDQFPTARIISRKPNPDNANCEILTIACPFCDKKHYHGHNIGQFGYGYRNAHCSNSLAYEIEE
jgi:hypothetical protein